MTGRYDFEFSGDKRQDIERRVLQSVTASFPVDEVTLDARLVEDLGADSLDQAELIIELEDEFEIDIPENQTDKIRSVKDIVDVIEQTLYPEDC